MMVTWEAAAILAEIRQGMVHLKNDHATSRRFGGTSDQPWRIVGDLDLSDLERIPSLEFVHCNFQGALLLCRSRLARLRLQDCAFEEGSAEPDDRGIIDLSDARIAGDLALLRVDSTRATANRRFLQARRATIGGDVDIEITPGNFPDRSAPALSMTHANVGGRLTIKGDPGSSRDAVQPSESMESLELWGLTVRDRLLLQDLRFSGSIHLESAKIGRGVELLRVSLKHVEVPGREGDEGEGALNAPFAQLGEHLLLDRCDIGGSLLLPFSTIAGDVRIIGCELRASDRDDYSVVLSDARVAGSLSVTPWEFGAEKVKITVHGGINLTRARILRNVTVRANHLSAKVTAKTPKCLVLDDAKIEGALGLYTSDGELAGEVDLTGATIQTLDFRNNQTRADGTRIDDLKWYPKSGSIRLQGSVVTRVSGLDDLRDLRRFLAA